MVRHLEQVGTPFTHESNGDASEPIKVNNTDNGVMVAVTNTAKTIEIVLGGAYYVKADADVFYRISKKAADNSSDSVSASTATTTASANPKWEADQQYVFRFEAGTKISVITASTANLEFIPTIK